MAIQGKSYYELSAAAGGHPNTISYGFEILHEADISVFADVVGGDRIKLIKNTDYTHNSVTGAITCSSAFGWDYTPSIIAEADVTDTLRIFRTTTTQALVDFTEGAVLSEKDLDTAYRQGLFAAQEVSEDASDTSPNGVQAVGTAQIDNLAVTSNELAAGSVITSKIADNAVTAEQIAGNAVTAEQIANNAVTNDAILNDAVTADKLAVNAVETDKITDDAVTYEKVAPATKDEMEGQSAAGVVTPDVLKNSPFSPRCYGTVTYDAATDNTYDNIDNTDNPPTVSGGFNVASVSEDSEDQRTITFTEALLDEDYTVLVSQQLNSHVVNRYPFVVTKGTTGFTIRANNGDVAGYSLNFVVFGSTYAE